MLSSINSVAQGDYNNVNLKQKSYSIGALSAKWESGDRGPGTISTSNDPGGLSYGTYQISIKHGAICDFFENEGAVFHDSFKDLHPGSKPFNKQWKSIADSAPEGFHLAQHKFIKRTHFEPLTKRLKRHINLDVTNYSPVFQDVIWSIAVQHGPYTNVIKNALQGHSIFSVSEAELIRCIYNERSKIRSGKMVYFPRVKDTWQHHLLQRFDQELEEALDTLELFGFTEVYEDPHADQKPNYIFTTTYKAQESYSEIDIASIENTPINYEYDLESNSYQTEIKRNYSPARINVVNRTRELIEELIPVTPLHTYNFIKSNTKFTLKQNPTSPSYRILLKVLDNPEYTFTKLPQGSVYVIHDTEKGLYKYYVGENLSYENALKVESLIYYKDVRVGRIVEH
jgi:hypothetical protein